jgi:hypothetical protein
VQSSTSESTVQTNVIDGPEKGEIVENNNKDVGNEDQAEMEKKLPEPEQFMYVNPHIVTMRATCIFPLGDDFFSREKAKSECDWVVMTSVFVASQSSCFFPSCINDDKMRTTKYVAFDSNSQFY